MENKIHSKVALTFDDVQIIPRFSEIESRSNCILKTRITKTKYINIPIVASPMDTICGLEMVNEIARLGGLGFIHRFNTIQEQSDIVYKSESEHIAAAVGVTGDWWERTLELIKHGCDIILLDVAHGHHINVKRAIEKIKSEYSSIDVIAGNVCTKQSSIDLCEWGVDGIRVGIGGGSCCSTRTQTACGVPNITSILDVCEISDQFDVPVIADGGIRYPGDVAKALGCGAETVMLGSLLAGTKETPGEIQKTGTWPNEQLFKKYRGSASLETKLANGLSSKNVEGVSRIVPYRGKVERIINDILDGLRSSMSYVGSKDINEFINKVEFVQVTNAGQIEARPHGLDIK